MTSAQHDRPSTSAGARTTCKVEPSTVAPTPDTEIKSERAAHDVDTSSNTTIHARPDTPTAYDPSIAPESRATATTERRTISAPTDSNQLFDLWKYNSVDSGLRARTVDGVAVYSAMTLVPV